MPPSDSTGIIARITKAVAYGETPHRQVRHPANSIRQRCGFQEFPRKGYNLSGDRLSESLIFSAFATRMESMGWNGMAGRSLCPAAKTQDNFGRQWRVGDEGK